MRRILIAACALVLLVVLPGVVIKRGPGGGGQTGDGGTPLSNLFYMGPGADQLCIDPDTDEDATVPDACDIAITPTGIDIAAGATGQCLTLKEAGAQVQQWCVVDDLTTTTGEVNKDFDNDQTPFDPGVLKCELFTYISPTAPTDHLLWKNTSGAAITIDSIDCIVDPADSSESVVITPYECTSSGDTCTTEIEDAITCGNAGAADDGTFTDASIADDNWIFLDYGTVTGSVGFLTYQICFVQSSVT